MGELTPEVDPVAQGVAAVLVVLEKTNHDGKHGQCKADSLDCPGHGWRYITLQSPCRGMYGRICFQELLCSKFCMYLLRLNIWGNSSISNKAAGARATAETANRACVFVSAGYDCCFFHGGQMLCLSSPCMRLLHQIMMNIICLHQQSTLWMDGINPFASSYLLP